MRAVLFCSAALVLGCVAGGVPVGPAPPGPPLQRAAPPLTPSAPAASAEPPAAEPAADAGDADAEEPNDDVDDDVEMAATGGTGKPPLSDVSDRDLEDRLRKDPDALGPISIGRPNAGALVHGLKMSPGDGYVLVDPGRAWGTRETIDGLVAAIREVRTAFPDTPDVYIGHISAEHGGHLSPHVSHQAGRDVDVGYYLLKEKRWYARATDKNLDKPRTWALIKALLVNADVEMILIDSGVQRLLRDYALASGEDAEYVNGLFQVGGRSQSPIIRHAKGHATHLHVRFWSPEARELGRRAYAWLVRTGELKPTAAVVTTTGSFFDHKARSGDTLDSLSRRYKVTVRAIMDANGLKTPAIKMGHVYKIPKPGTTTTHVAARPIPPPESQPIVAPPRRVPPPRRAAAG